MVDLDNARPLNTCVTQVLFNAWQHDVPSHFHISTAQRIILQHSNHIHHHTSLKYFCHQLKSMQKC